MRKAGVDKIVFSSTAAVYGEPEKTPIEEDFPHNPTNVYGRTKLVIEDMMRDFTAAYGLSYVALRYFNAAGAEVTVHGGNVHPGSAKDIMKNAQTIAMEIHGLLPKDACPEKTEGYEGFYHMTEIDGNL